MSTPTKPELTLVKGAPPRDRWLSQPKVTELTGLGRSWIYDAMKTKGFPTPTKLSARCVRWSEAAILTWMANQVADQGREAA